MAEKFDTVKKGYSPAQVNEYIDTLEAVIRGYKEKESSIMKAIVSAQSTADGIIKEAEARAADMEKSARQKRDEILAYLEEQTAKISLFQQEYAALVQKHLIPLNSGEFARLTSKANDLRGNITGIEYTPETDE